MPTNKQQLTFMPQFKVHISPFSDINFHTRVRTHDGYRRETAGIYEAAIDIYEKIQVFSTFNGNKYSNVGMKDTEIHKGV